MPVRGVDTAWLVRLVPAVDKEPVAVQQEPIQILLAHSYVQIEVLRPLAFAGY